MPDPLSTQSDSPCPHDKGIHLHGTATICNLCGEYLGITTVAFDRLVFVEGDRLEWVRCGGEWELVNASAMEDRRAGKLTVALAHAETQAEALRQVAEWCDFLWENE